jgi:hypothetical protein
MVLLMGEKAVPALSSSFVGVVYVLLPCCLRWTLRLLTTPQSLAASSSLAQARDNLLSYGPTRWNDRAVGNLYSCLMFVP